MALTPRGYPYPDLTDAPAGPVQIQGSVQAIDTDVQAVADQRLVMAMMQVQATGASIDCHDGTERLVGFYSDGIQIDIDPTDLISYAGGTFTVAKACIVGYSITAFWDTLSSGTPAHHRDLYVKRNGSSNIADGRKIEPIPAAPGGGWPALIQSTSGHVICADGATLQAALNQTSGGTVNVTTMLFTVWLASMDLS